MTSAVTPAAKQLIAAAKRLSAEVSRLSFAPPTAHVYNPLQYAWKPHREYLRRCTGPTRALFLGMNPGPWGMAQTGVPFGEVDMVRDWLGIDAPVDRPENEHPKRLVEGFLCGRSEVSGKRLWGLFRDRYETSERFFDSHFVVNYCPLVFMESTARNRTPDKLPADELRPLSAACDDHLASILLTLAPEFAVGVGVYAQACFERVVASMGSRLGTKPKILKILHPSPASPSANRDWAGQATSQLIDGGVWRR